jgi:hypothetical protein
MQKGDVVSVEDMGKQEINYSTALRLLGIFDVNKLREPVANASIRTPSSASQLSAASSLELW